MAAANRDWIAIEGPSGFGKPADSPSIARSRRTNASATPAKAVSTRLEQQVNYST